jgi:hypothetical protein
VQINECNSSSLLFDAVSGYKKCVERVLFLRSNIIQYSSRCSATIDSKTFLYQHGTILSNKIWNINEMGEKRIAVCQESERCE